MKKLLLAFLLLTFSFPTIADAGETAYDRVMKSSTIRCGYALWPTYLELDPNTGELSGIWYDYVEELAKKLSLKVEWTTESNYGQASQDLKTGRYDVFCSGIWLNASRSREMDFTIPITYQVVEAFVRKGDSRFDDNLEVVNDPAIKVSTIDGEMADTIRKEDFPKSTSVGLPQISESSQLLLNVVENKADITFTSPETVERFLLKNPDVLQKVKTDRPLRLFPEVLAVKMGEHSLRQMLSNATKELLFSGTIEKIIKKHEEIPGSFYRVAKPYEVIE
ncbi:MAG: transporter substrate-binding domain-containing protein [Alphaproteobacteria bacterium]|nr:transporter substrate-binding domain-containing protein [Alphaproteobacteria bacterium]